MEESDAERRRQLEELLAEAAASGDLDKVCEVTADLAREFPHRQKRSPDRF